VTGRTCTQCGTWKPAEEFSLLKTGKLNSHCNPCKARQTRNAHLDEPEPEGARCCHCLDVLEGSPIPEPRPTATSDGIEATFETQVWNWCHRCWLQEQHERKAMKVTPRTLHRIASIEGTYRGEDASAEFRGRPKERSPYARQR